MRSRILVLVALAILSMLIAGCFGLNAINQTIVSLNVAEKALNNALNVEGYPYSWGARGPDEFDCSGLITWAYKRAVGRTDIFREGNTIMSEATIWGLWLYNTERLLPEALAPGDIVFITNTDGSATHGGLFVRWLSEDELEFINASSYYGTVVIDSWPIVGTKRGQWFVGGGRLKIVY